MVSEEFHSKIELLRISAISGTISMVGIVIVFFGEIMLEGIEDHPNHQYPVRMPSTGVLGEGDEGSPDKGLSEGKL